MTISLVFRSVTRETVLVLLPSLNLALMYCTCHRYYGDAVGEDDGTEIPD